MKKIGEIKGIKIYDFAIDCRKAKLAKPGLIELCEFVTENNTLCLSMVEIGSFSGVSASIFAQFFPVVYCVDPWCSGYDDKDLGSNPKIYNMKKVEAQFNEVAKMYKHIFKKKGKSLDIAKDFIDGGIDMVYIDAIHQYKPVKDDIKTWLPKIVKGGILAGHDYGSKHFPGVKKAVNEMIGKPDKVFSDTSWIKLL